MRLRHALAALGLALVATLATLAGLLGGVATAQTTPPAPPTCAEATATLTGLQTDYDAALPALLEFSPDVYPGGTVPTLAQLPALIPAILADPDLGGGARELVEAADVLRLKVQAAAVAKATACTPPTTTPVPPATTTPAPTTVPPTSTPVPTTTPKPDGLPTDNDPGDGVAYRPNTSGGIRTGGA